MVSFNSSIVSSITSTSVMGLTFTVEEEVVVVVVGVGVGVASGDVAMGLEASFFFSTTRAFPRIYIEIDSQRDS